MNCYTCYYGNTSVDVFALTWWEAQDLAAKTLNVKKLSDIRVEQRYLP